MDGNGLIPEHTSDAVVMVNRSRSGDDAFTIRLPWLKASGTYQIEINGEKTGSISGKSLNQERFTVWLDEYRSAVIAFYK